MYAVLILALIYGASLLPRVAALYLIIFGLARLGILIRYEIRFPNPVFEVRLFHQKVNLPMILNPPDRLS